VHPSLYPVLVLLSRLRPGPPRQAILSPLLSPAAFAPLVRRCAAARLYAVRQLAAAALSPLVPSEAGLLLSRLGQSLQSPDYDIRAAAAKALAALVEQALAG
ncbi:DUF2428 domain-containing protein, partial [Haematococcus lacustris]